MFLPSGTNEKTTMMPLNMITINNYLARVCSEIDCGFCALIDLFALIFLWCLAGLDRLRRSCRRAAGVALVRAVARRNSPEYLEGPETLYPPPIELRGEGGGEDHEEEEEESSQGTAENKSNADDKEAEGNNNNNNNGGTSSNDDVEEEKKKTNKNKKLIFPFAKARASHLARAAAKAAQEQAPAEERDAKAAAEKAFTALWKKTRAQEKKQERALMSSKNKNKGRNNGRFGSIFNLTATAAAAAAGDAAVAAPANDTTTTTDQDPSLHRDPGFAPVHRPYHWEEDHPAMSQPRIVPTDAVAVAVAPASSPSAPRSVVESEESEAEEAFSVSASALVWVSLGSAMLGAGLQVFDVLELLSFATSF